MRIDTEVVVVGGGNAGLCAALAAAESGARVTLLDACARDRRGGNSRNTGGLFRVVYNSFDEILALAPSASRAEWERGGSPTYTRADYLADIRRLTNGKADVALTETYVDASYSTMEWMRDVGGVEWTFSLMKWEVPNPGACVRARGNGVGLVEALYDACERHGVDLRYDSFALDWSHVDGRYAVEFVTGGESHVVAADAIVLGCGGFEADRAKREKHLGGSAGEMRVRGTRFNTGQLLDVALREGANSVGEWSECHATPVDAGSDDYPDPERAVNWSRHSYPFGITLNREGVRFFDEGEDYSLYTYAKTGVAILRQPGAIAFQVFDDAQFRYADHRYELDRCVAAATLDELLRELSVRYGLDAAAAARTVEAFNAAVSEAPFDPMTKDGKATSGQSPDKTNWATPLVIGPFRAFPVSAGITFTYGGLEIDPNGAVLRAGGTAFPALYATGEITGGFFSHNYPAGAGLMRGAVFGKLGGTRAAAGLPTAAAGR